MSTPPALSSRPAPAAAVASPRMLAVMATPVVPALTVTAAALCLAIYVGLAAHNAGADGLVAVAVVLITAGVVASWLVSAGGVFGRANASDRSERLAQRALPFLAFLPAGALAPEFAFGQPGGGRIALVLGTCLLLFAILSLHAAGWTAGVVAHLDRRAGLWLGLLVAGHLVVTTALVIVRHHYHNAILGEDTAYYNQIFWSTLNGDFFRGSLTQGRYTDPPIHSEFGAHNSPVLFLLLPAYWAHPSFLTLLAVRNLALSISAVPLFLLVRPRFGGAVALGVAAVHLLGPNLISQSVNAFYPLQFATLALPLVFLAFERGRFAWFIGAFVLALSVREELALTLILFAGFALLRRRAWPWVLVPAVLALAWWYVSTRFVMVPSRIAMEDLEQFYQAFPDGYGGAAAALLREPIAFLKLVATTDNAAYLYQLAKWTAGIGLATPALLFAAPTALINIVVGAFWKTTTSIGMHYSVVAATAVSVSLVYGLAGLARGHRAFRTDARAFALVLVLLLTPQVVLGVKDVMAYGGGRQKSLVEDLRPRPYFPTLERIVALVEADPTAAVAAPNDLLPHLSHRRDLYNTSRLWWYGTPRLDYVVVDGDVQRFDRGAKHRARYRELIDAMRADPAYQLLVDEHDFRLYRIDHARTGGAR